MRHRFALSALGLALAAALASACTNQTDTRSAVVEPTIAPIFNYQPQVKPTPIPPVLPTIKPNPTREVAAPSDPRTLDVTIYDDKLAAGWSLKPSEGMTYTEALKTVHYEGAASIAATPRKAFGQLILGVKKDAPTLYRRDDVLGVRFMVSGGSNDLPLDGLIVTVYGSKKYTYFVAGDRSATQPPGRITSDDPLFPETRLYFLGLNRDLPRGEWAEITMWLDEHFTPDYTYVTGLIIKNDEGYQKPFYVDNVTLILKKP